VPGDLRETRGPPAATKFITTAVATNSTSANATCHSACADATVGCDGTMPYLSVIAPRRLRDSSYRTCAQRPALILRRDAV
jgi:hypothetical protein